MLWVAAISACLGAIVAWQFAVIASLRVLGISIPFSVAFHIYPRRQKELLDALGRRGKDAFVLVSGILLLAFPLFVGINVYDYIIDRSVGQVTYGLDHIVGSAVAFLLMVACGIGPAQQIGTRIPTSHYTARNYNIAISLIMLCSECKRLFTTIELKYATLKLCK